MKEKKIIPVSSSEFEYDEFDNLDGMTAEEDAEAYLDAIDNTCCHSKKKPVKTQKTGHVWELRFSSRKT